MDSRAVVDAVADKKHALALPPQTLHDGDLVKRLRSRLKPKQILKFQQILILTNFENSTELKIL